MGITKGYTFGVDLLETEKAYIAGLVDGEGSIGLFTCNTKGSSTPTYYLQISITNTNKEVLFWVASKIKYGKVGVKPRNNKKWKIAYNWRVNGVAGKFLEVIYPYLKIKRLQAEIGIEYTKTLQKYEHHYRLTEEVNVGRKELFSKIRELNLKGDKQWLP